MSRTDLSNPGAKRAKDLVALSRQINDREEVIILAQGKCFERTSEWLCEMALQGQALLQVKQILKHGDFMPWLRSNCPLISDRSARNYMRIASNWQTSAKVEGSKSIAEALRLIAQKEIDEDPATAQKAMTAVKKSWPPFVEAVGRFRKFEEFVGKNPISKWPEEGRDKLREKLEPIAMALWPDKFK